MTDQNNVIHLLPLHFIGDIKNVGIEIDVGLQQMGAFANDLYAKYGVAGAPTGGLRLCPHVYNSMEDVDQTIRAVRELIG